MRIGVGLLLAGTLAGGGCSRLALDNPSGAGEFNPPPPPLPSAHPTVGLISAVGGATSLRIDWRVQSIVGDLPEIAVFVGPDRATVFNEPPEIVDSHLAHVIRTGLDTGMDLWVGLGVRAGPTDPFVPSGPVLRALTRAPVYVNPAADPGGGDGTTPGTAFGDLALGVLTALANGGGNVWVAEGEIGASSIPVFPGVYVHGGFDGHLLLGRRDPERHPTRILGAPGQPVFALQSGSGTSIVDGFTIDGLNVASAGIEAVHVGLELRQLEIEHCQRGVKLRASFDGAPEDAILTAVHASTSAIQGLSLEGPFTLAIEASHFELNHDEGADLNSLIAPVGGIARVSIRGSRFDRNGTEGLDLHLGTPPTAADIGGSFEVTIHDCDFELNGLDGARIDVDYEGFPAWTSHTLVRGVRARANGGAGLHLDLDASATALVHRLSASANAGDGLFVSSESFAGMATLSSSACFGNQGAGARVALGNVALIASHCVFSGNFGGAFVSEIVPSMAVSSIAEQENTNWQGVVARGSVIVGSGDPLPFLRAPRQYARVVGLSGTDLVLDTTLAAATGSIVEFNDDGITRTIVSSAGTTVALDPAPTVLTLPAVITVFESQSGGDRGNVDEDWRLAPASTAVGAGMAPPAAGPVDAGIFGQELGGVPGREDPITKNLFRLAATAPAWSVGIAANASLSGHFQGGAPDPATVPFSVFVIDAQGTSVPITPFVENGALVIPAPLAGWMPGMIVEIFPTLASMAGDPLVPPIGLLLGAP